jgi:threonine aldolase
MGRPDAGVARAFASDNNAGAHPEVVAAVAAANAGHAAAYGDDPWTPRAVARVRALVGETAEVFFVFGGTAANVLGLGTVLRAFEAVICAEGAHIDVDECGAPEHVLGVKLLPVPAPDGKVTIEAAEMHLRGIGVPHHVQPRVLSLTQSTEYGTVYTVEEIRALAGWAHAHDLLVHMDGARLANAAATLGVDVLSFGGTKNGALGAEAVVFFDPMRARDFPYVRKQGMQLASKMRFLAAQFDALLTDELWRRAAGHANAMARRLADGVRELPGVRITQRVEANAIFAELPRAAIAPLQSTHRFYVWNDRRNEVRWMTSWDTTEDDVDEFVERIREVLRETAAPGGDAEVVAAMAAAAESGDVRKLGALIRRHAALIDCPDARGWTPLHLAAHFGHADAVKLLLDHHANVHVRSTNAMANQPIHAAIAGRHRDAIEALLDRTADVNATQHGGWTPLMAAAQQGDADLVVRLLALGADPTAESEDGSTALSLAEKGGHAEAARLLRPR